MPGNYFCLVEKIYMSKHRLLSIACLVVTVALIAISMYSSAQAQDESKFTPTYRLWPRTGGGYILNNGPLAAKNINPAGIDFRGTYSTYANKTAFAWLLGGKKGAAPDGSVFVIEFFQPTPLVPGQIFIEGDKAPLKFSAWMFKDAAEYKDNGGWGWEAWVLDKAGKDAPFGGKALDAKTQGAACMACHVGFAKTSDLVIETFSDQAHVQAIAAELGITVPTQAATTPAPTTGGTKPTPVGTKAR